MVIFEWRVTDLSDFWVRAGEDERLGESILYQIPQIISALKHVYLTIIFLQNEKATII